MNRRQIVAGNVGPDTEIPCTDVIGISPLGYPIHTVASSEGVNPQNQASAKLSVVPVFPADVRPKYAPRPVPEAMFSGPTSRLKRAYTVLSERNVPFSIGVGRM